MPRKRKSIQELMLSGQLRKNPGRYAGRLAKAVTPQTPREAPKPLPRLAPSYFNSRQTEVWKELKKQFGAALNAHDALELERSAILLEKSRRPRTKMSPSELKSLDRYLVSFRKRIEASTAEPIAASVVFPELSNTGDRCKYPKEPRHMDTDRCHKSDCTRCVSSTWQEFESLYPEIRESEINEQTRTK